MLLKLKNAPSFSIQLDETTDVSSEAQLIVFCRFADITREKLAKHYLFCKPLGVNAIANCKSVTTDGAAAMTRTSNGVVQKIKEGSPECVSVYCILHRETLVAKKIERIVVKMIPLSQRYSRKLLALLTIFEAM